MSTKTARTKTGPTPTRAEAIASRRARFPQRGNPFEVTGAYMKRHRATVEANRGGGRERAAKLFADVPTVTVLTLVEGTPVRRSSTPSKIRAAVRAARRAVSR